MPNIPNDPRSPDHPANPLFAKEIADGAFFAGIATMLVVAVVVIGSITHRAEMQSASAASPHPHFGRAIPGKG
jgi:hypothetical protein